MAIAQNFLVQLNSNQTGQTLTARLYDRSNVQIGTDISTGFTELGNGDYEFVYSSFPTTFVGSVRIYISGVYQAYVPFSAIDASANAKIISLNAQNVVVQSPFATDGTLSVVRGDAYSDILGNALPWNIVTEVDLTDVDVFFAAKNKYSGSYDLVSVPATVTPSDDGWSVKVELTKDQTAALSVGSNTYLYDLQAVIVNDLVEFPMTLARGSMTVIEDFVDAD